MIKRKSNLELLRILSMILIFLWHYVYWGINDISINSISNRLLFDFISLGGRIGVNIFILISSWFLIESKFSMKKLVVLVLKVKIYAIGFLLIAFLLKENLSVKWIVISLFPILFKEYWFITCYIMLYLFFPYLNLVLTRLKKNELKLLLMLLILIFCILQTFIGTRLFYSEFIWFIVLYFIVFYIKKYCIIREKNFFLKASIVIYIIIFTGIEIVKYLNLRIYLISEYSITGLIFSLMIFLYFLQINIRYNKLINFISSGTLAVYLIHENIFGRNIVWERILKISKIVNSQVGVVILHIIVSVLLIFILGIFLDKVLQYILDNFLDKKINNLTLFLEEKRVDIVNKIIKFSEKFEIKE